METDNTKAFNNPLPNANANANASSSSASSSSSSSSPGAASNEASGSSTAMENSNLNSTAIPTATTSQQPTATFKNYTISHYPTPNHTPTPINNNSITPQVNDRRSSIGAELSLKDFNGVPYLSRDFVVRRISEGETGRLKEELKCEACGKGYKHITSLAKHLWEHTPEWQMTKKFSISKHQQVQLLEAASILCSLCETTEQQQQQQQVQQQQQQPSYLADSLLSSPPPPSTITRQPKVRRKSNKNDKAAIKSIKERNKSFSIEDKLLLGNRKMSGSWKPPMGFSRRGSLIGSLIKEEDSQVIMDSDDE
ncbi:hypothetical protein DAMA08_028070 [Martiniozyma asiatica (nom. inval.)]|nr:hypothetical protein DAMA08_028070 [Martiniozyma asiatica]